MNNQTTQPAFSVGDRVTTVKSESLPESMEGIPCIVMGVDMGTVEEYFRYEVAFRMDHKTPIRIGEDVIANEFLDRSNLRMGWQNDLGHPRREQSTD